MIGDDDIFSKHLIDYCTLWSKLGYEAVLPNKASYIWADVKPRLYKNRSGVIRFSDYTGKVVPIDIAGLPDKIVRLGGTDMSNLPRVYHGIIKKSILDRVYEYCGSYCPGPSPDIANGIALCRYLTNYVYVDLPLITSGTGVNSAGGKGAQGEHYSEVKDVLQLHKGCASQWDKRVPFYWSGKTIYAESVCKALTAMGMLNKLSLFNFEYLYASCLVFDWRYRTRIIDTIKCNIGKIKLYKILLYFISIMSSRIKFHLKSNLARLIKSNTLSQYNFITAPHTLEVAKLLDDMFGPPSPLSDPDLPQHMSKLNEDS